MLRKDKFRYIPLLVFFTLILSLFLISCNSDNSVTTSGSSNGSVSMMADMTGTDDNILVIQSAKFLIEFVKLEREHGSDDVDLKEGPFVVSVDLTGRVTTFAIGLIPGGTFNEVHIKIHKHTPNEVVIDPDFGTNGVGYSGIITGTYNGIPFVYRTAITSSQEVDINPPLIAAAALLKMNVTLLVKPGVWFVKNGILLNPMDAVNQHDIDDNIKDSFREAFEDNDKDGHHDH